jgi:MFS-type transporter involved in bile tolerance (Atg22 family)
MLITIAPAFMAKAIGINLQTGSLLVVGPLGIGILIGALTLGFEEKYFSKQKLVVAGFLGMGLLIAALSLINFFQHDYKYIYYAVVALIIGYFNAHIFAPSHSILQTNALSHLRGRIYGSLYVILQVAATLPTIIVGVLADRVTLTHVIGGLGILLFIFGLFLLPRARALVS